MIEVVYKTGVYCSHHPYIGFLYSFAVFVLVFDKHLVVSLVASDVCILFDDAAECLIEIREEILCLAEQTVCRSLILSKPLSLKNFTILSTGIAYMYLSCARPAMNEPSYCELRKGASGALPEKNSSCCVYVRTWYIFLIKRIGMS